MKKLFTLIVAICATTLAWADDSGYCGGHGIVTNISYTYVESTGTLTISGTGDMYSYFDKSDRPWHTYSSSIKKVVINNGVTSVGWHAFEDCTGLTSVTIPNSVTSIENDAFSGCSNIENADINSQSALDAISFTNKLTSIKLGNKITSIGNSKFQNCANLTSVTIPSSVTSIGDYAFDNCKGLTSITIPNSVTSIGKSAFYECTGLTSVTIPNSVTSIGDDAFFYCTGLTNVTIPNSVTSIGDDAFDYCKGLTSINVAEDNSNYASIDGVLYSKDKTTVITCPHGKTGSVTIPNGVTSIDGHTFYGHTGLTSITIPNSVTEISGSAFYGCTGLTSVTIGNGVTSIGRGVFTSCTGLTSMTVEATNPPSCDVNKYNLGLGMPNYNIPLYVPAGSVDAYKAAKEWKRFTNIQAIPATGVNEATAEKSEVKKIIDRNGIIYIEKDGTRYFLNGGKVE
ncbi:MAG: leucine-rich repeat domain-containing protein [Paludibacteraceae bacterium]|nr:leucine-rich repeat domain-containing protein [Paludibacteraceae bacterium]